MELNNASVNYDDSNSEAAAEEFAEEYDQYCEMGDEFECENDAGEVEEEAEPMQLQAMQHRGNKPYNAPFLSREEFTRCMKEGLCLRCKKPGHVARDCSLPPPPRRSSSSSSYRNPMQSQSYASRPSANRSFPPSRRNF